MKLNREIRISEVMTRMPTTVAPEISVREAKHFMQTHRIRHLPVLNRGELVGIVSDRDIRSGESFRGPGHLSVGDVMKADPYVTRPDFSLVEVLTEMVRRKIGSALVKSPRGVVIGIFTSHDALLLLTSLMVLGTRESSDASFHSDVPDVPKAA